MNLRGHPDQVPYLMCLTLGAPTDSRTIDTPVIVLRQG